MRKLLSLCLLWLAIGAQAQQQQPEDFSAARKLQIAEFAIQQLYVDPVNEVIGLFAGNPCRESLKRKSRVDVSCTPWAVSFEGGAYGFTVSLVM